MHLAILSYLNVTPSSRKLRCLTAYGLWACGLVLTANVWAQTGWRQATVGPASAASAWSAPASPTVAPPPADIGLQGEGWLQMFGVRLSTATREEIRQAMRQEGLIAQREDTAFTEDIYDAPNLMPGLLQLKFSYARESQRLARVDYVFTTFMDNAHAGELMQRIQSRYGRPANISGREESGPYHAVWRLQDQMEVFVGREWPSKNTYLKFFNVAVLGSSAADEAREVTQQHRGQAQNPNALPIWVKR